MIFNILMYQYQYIQLFKISLVPFFLLYLLPYSVFMLELYGQYILFFIHQSFEIKQQTKFLDLRFQNNNGFEENIKSFHLKVAGHKLDYDCKKRHGAQVIFYL